MLSGQIADAMVRQINAIGAGPVTGLPLALAIQTGDNSDNSQFNEIRWNIQVLNGGARAGRLGQPGPSTRASPTTTATYYDPGYWHPHGTPAGQGRRRLPQALRLPGGARACSTLPARRSTAEGLNMPWYSAFGNHDGLVQGNFPQNLQLSLRRDRRR